MDKKIKILVVDDHPFLRRGLCDEINLTPDMIAVGEANNGQEAVLKANLLQPDLVLMDILLPNMNGVEATRQIVQQNPDIQILVLSGFFEDATIVSAIKAGASGYLRKDASPEEVIEAIRSVVRGDFMLNSRIVRKLFQEIREGDADKSSLSVLTDREREILIYLAKGLSNQEIALQASIAESTVRCHVHHILDKLNLNSRTQAILLAVKEGLVEVEP